MKKKLFFTMLAVVLVLVLSLTVFVACNKDKKDNTGETPATYSVTVNGGTGGGEYTAGATVKITANAPETGKEFTSWTIEGVTVDDKTKAEITFTMPANAVTATANYEFIDYTVTVVGGTANKTTAHYGDSITITAAAPETGKEFTSWTLSGVTVDDKTKAEITFTMPANAVTATANYGDVQYEFALENCTADKETAKFGEQVTFTADEVIGKRFDSWNIKGVDDLTGLDLTKSPLTITMPANDINVAAVLEDIDYTVTVTGGTAQVNGGVASASVKAHYGDSITITAAAPETGKRFTGWTLEGVRVYDKTKAEITFTMPANAVTATANYDFESYEIKVTGGAAQVNDGGPFSTNAAHYGDNVKIKAHNPGTGMKFKNWTITGVDTSELVLTNEELTFTMPANAVTATANYDFESYEIKVTGGAAQVNDGGPFSTNAAHYGDNVKIKAHNPGTGMKFKNWTITGIDTSGLDLTASELTFKMPANKVTATANYDFINYTVSVTGGTANKTTAHYGEEVTITAEVPVGKDFVMWSFEGFAPDGLTLTDKELTFTMPANNVTATAELRDLVKRSVTVQGGVAQVGDGKLETSLKAYCGDTVTLTAYQDPEKTFVKWTIEGIDDTTGLDLTQRVLTFTMPDNDVSATAEFENVPTNLTFDGNVATSGELRYVNYDSKSFRLPLGSGQDLCTYTIELSNSAFTFKVYGSDGEVVPYDNGDGVMCIDINRDDNYTIEVINTGTAANCTLTVTKV